MLTDTLTPNSGLNQGFPAQQLSKLLAKTEAELQAYYQSWRTQKKTARPNYDQAFIAGLVGQSKTTVSNFVNQRGNISGQKQLLLQQVIDLLDYKPSLSAQLIRAKEKKVIAVVANITQTPSKDYTSSIIEGIKTQARQYHYELLLYDVTQQEQGEFIRRMPFWGLVDGLIVIGSMLEQKDYAELEKRELAVALINPWSKVYTEHSIVCCIKADMKGLEDLFRHYQHQVKRPVLLTIRVDKYRQRQRKIALYQEYFGQNSKIIYLDNYSVASVEKIKGQLDRQNDAFFCLADLVAICVVQYLRKLGLESLVTGYDNTDIARVFQLPTVNHNITQQGMDAFSKLFLALSYKKMNDCFPACELAELKSDFVLNAPLIPP